MTFNRNDDQTFGEGAFKWSVFLQVHEAVFCEILNVFYSLLKRGRHLVHPLLEPRRLTNLFSERVIAVMRVGCQHEYRNRIGLVKPQQDCALKLTYGSLFLAGDKYRGAGSWLRLFAWFAAHGSRCQSSCDNALAPLLRDVIRGFDARHSKGRQRDHSLLI